jgi:hypothetical protein
MATISNTYSSTGDYYTYNDHYAYNTPYYNLPVTTGGASGLHYDYVIYDDFTFTKETKKKGDDKMTALWRVIVLDPTTEDFDEIKVIAKTEDMAIHKALKELKPANEDELEIDVEKLIEFKKRTKKGQLKEALKEAMEE